MTEDEMVGWHHQLNGHEFDKAPGDGEGQESLECCSPWGCKESDRTERLNNNKRYFHCCSSFDQQLFYPLKLREGHRGRSLGYNNRGQKGLGAQESHRALLSVNPAFCFVT